MSIQDKRRQVSEWEKTLTADSVATFQNLKDNRTIVRTKLTKNINSLDASTGGLDIFEIKENLKNVIKNRDDLEDRDARIWLYMAQDPNILEADSDIGQQLYYNPCIKIISKAQKRIAELEPPASTTATASGSTPSHPPGPSPSSKVKLPKISLPVFKGKSPSEFKGFWNKFYSMVELDSSLDDITRLQYLQSCCQDEAKIIADGYAVTDSNYLELKNALHNLFGSKRLVVQSYMEDIIDLPHCSQIGLKSFLTSLDTAVRSVKEYGVEDSHIAPLVIPLIERKMQKEDFTKWKELVHGDTDFSLQKLLKFLLERLQCKPISESEPRKQSAHRQKPPHATTFLTLNSTDDPQFCHVCETDTHTTLKCRKLLKLKPQKRVDLVRSKRLCYKCLGKSSKIHNCTNCANADNCAKCDKTHNTILHLESNRVPSASLPESVPTSKEVSASNDVAGSTTINVAPGNTSGKLLKTLVVTATQGEKEEKLRALIDSGSDEAWITSKVKDKLNLPVIGHKTLAISTAFEHEFSKPHTVEVVEINLITEQKELFPVIALVHDGPIVAPLKAVEFDPQKEYPHLEGLKIADSYPRGRREVDIIIGAAYEEKIKIGPRRMAETGPDAVQTIFGWVLSGELPNQGETNQTIVACNRIAIEEQLRKFWEIEELPTPPVYESKNDQDVFTAFNKAARFDEEKGQFVVKIPYTEEVKDLQPNFEKVSQMMKYQEARLAKKPELKEKVVKILEKQLEEGIIEKVTEEDSQERQVHYVPWHTVIREWHETTPIRIVYNLSNKDKNGLSLNSCQSAGPNLLPDTIKLLTQFRSKKVGFTVDIRKMFHQILLDDEQKDLHRFLAFNEVYRFLTLVMGETSSPFCAMATCALEAARKENILPLAAEVIKSCLYMDDPIASSDEVDEAVRTVRELLILFKGIHMKCHKLCSNSQSLLESFAEEGISIFKDIAEVLGIKWNTKEDSFSVKTSPSTPPRTKRDLLSKVSQIFDPLGFHAPLVCKGKQLMQKAWENKCDWNEVLSQELQLEVNNWMEASKFGIKVPRYLGKVTELHIFCDASENAYAAVAYSKAEGEKPILLLSKTRVKPMRVVSLPRMELMAAILAARLYGVIKNQFDTSKITFWSDSCIVMNWIQAESSHFKTFVANRISEIQTTTNPAQWKWLPGKTNPADLPSRGTWPLTPQEEQLWKHGPEFLQTGEYPVPPTASSPKEELRRSVIQVATVESKTRLVDINRFSKLCRLLNTVSYVFRFCKPKAGVEGAPSVEENNRSLQFLIQEDQQEYFQNEVSQLNTQKQVSNSSKIKSLDPMMDEEAVMRMKARNQDYNPIILHPKSRLTKLIIENCHQENLHCGAPTTLNILREKYWIPAGLQTVKKVTKACVICRKVNTPLCHEQMAPLPEFRIKPSNPFVHTGLDFAGPLLVTKGAQKRYILLFTCGSTRAVHLELTRSMNFKDFQMAFTRFLSRRGKPTVVYSDNAKTFSQAADYYKNKLQWKFITPRAPWHGAFWERLVKTIKEPLKKTLGNQIVTETELSTILVQVEAIVNERPLSAIIEDDELKTITPSLLLNGRNLHHVYEEDLGFEPTKRLKFLHHLKDAFWIAWKKLYIPSLMTKARWTRAASSPLQAGDIILLLKENTKRQCWPLGRIMHTIPGRDGNIRTIEVLVNGKRIRRPIQHAVLLSSEKMT